MRILPFRINTEINSLLMKCRLFHTVQMEIPVRPDDMDIDRFSIVL